MAHDMDAGYAGVQPVRYLVVGDDVDVACPGRVHVQGTQGVPQFVTAEIARGIGRLAVVRRARVLRPPGQPCGVRAVDPGVDDVDGEADLVHGVDGEVLPGGNL